MGESISDIEIPEQPAEDLLRRFGRPALLETVPPFDPETYAMLTEL